MKLHQQKLFLTIIQAISLTSITASYGGGGASESGLKNSPGPTLNMLLIKKIVGL